MKIIADENIPYLRGRLEGLAEVIYADQNEFTRELVSDADALLIRTRTRCNESLLKDSTVRLVATATIGTDQIDIPWCESHGITVRNSPGCNAPGVAQYVWSSILHIGIDPAKVRIGVIGHGNVGSIVAEWGRRLGAEVLVNDPYKDDIATVELPYLLQNTDIVTLHTPLTLTGSYPTFHLIGAKELKMMKPGALLINAARGPVTDTRALVEALKERKIRAVIDTWEGEPVIDRELLDCAEIGTFHIAGYSREGKERATRMVLEALEEKFGLTIDKSGLAGDYTEAATLTAESIKDSYNPYEDDRLLRTSPDDFEQLRHDYNYRREVGSND